MKPPIKLIENAELVESIFGGWPSFHDAEVHSVVMTREGEFGPQLEVTIHHWKTTPEVDSTGHYVHRHNTLTTLRFLGVSELKLAGFNGQNVLWDLEISEVAGAEGKVSFAVSMPTNFGCEASFKCGRIRVMSAVPYTTT